MRGRSRHECDAGSELIYSNSLPGSVASRLRPGKNTDEPLTWTSGSAASGILF